MYKVELLAPAGGFESLNAALNAGADAVFFGVGEINMRATNTANFKIEDLAEISRLTKEKGAKSYLTLNTILYNNDLKLVEQIIDEAKKSNIDAVIAADIATIMYARSVGLEVHISTQLSVSNTASVKFYSQFSDRIVLARELSLEKVAEICKDIKDLNIVGPKGNLVEIEVFAHGALCVAVSGRCSMSLYCYGSSANRGKCTQVCRHKYKVVDLETSQELVVDNNYVMSASDLCTIGLLDKLLETGVTVLKFEGRGRGPEYVQTVIECYKEAVEAINNGTYNKTKIEDWNKRLGTVFNRGFSAGLYMGRHFDEWAGLHGSKATKEKQTIGKVVKYYPKAGVIEIKLTTAHIVEKGQEIIITGKDLGVQKIILNNFWLNENPVEQASKGDLITLKVSNTKFRSGDLVFIYRDKVIT